MRSDFGSAANVVTKAFLVEDDMVGREQPDDGIGIERGQ